ncbi:anillin isoform X2 [Myripristis murdjan]|uniref:anillin isoform X2 n=1 Tax=Myripristis murdjan TaxID=586833 RepID=UPI001175E1B4|nr:anillin isoform X2 [Myripristis murdjan]
MDPFTEKLLERTRARRENLQKKMAERPTAANRQMAKRSREPLAEANSVISEPVIDKAPQLSSKPSPSKRRCSGETVQTAAGEENQEPSTTRPAVSSLPDPPTDKKPPTGPASIRPASSLEKNIARPVVHSHPVQAKPVPEPEPDKMIMTPAPDALLSSTKVETVSASPALQRNKEDLNEAPTLSAPGMKSRLQRLAEQRQYWDNEDVVPNCAPPSPLKRQFDDPTAASSTASSSEAPLGRRGRLANLAATIGSWEDDLSHPGPRKDNAQGKAGTACVPKLASRDASVSTNSKPSAAGPVLTNQTASSKSTSSSNQAVYSPVKSSREVLSNPQKAELPAAKPAASQKSSHQGTSYLSSPQKAGFSGSAPLPQSPLKNQALSRGLDITSSPKKPNLPAKPATSAPSDLQNKDKFTTKDSSTPLQQKVTTGTPGVKSFLERFGEKCQERTNQSSPAGGATQGKTPTVTPNTRLVQERLRAAQAAKTTTADLTQRQKLEREAELAQLRSRFQKGDNMWKNKDEEAENKKNTESKEQAGQSQEPHVAQSHDEPTTPSVDSTDSTTNISSPPPTSAGHGSVVSPPVSTSSPLKKVSNLVEKPCNETPEEEVVQEIEMNVDQSINSAVINELFEGVLEQSSDEHDDKEEESDEEDGLNISSMSLLAPFAETVAAVVKSPEKRMMTSTPASSFSEKSKTPNSTSKPSKFQRAHMIQTGSSDSVEASEDEDHKLPYSIDAYRSVRVKETERPNVKQVIVRKEDVSHRVEEAGGTSLINIKQKMKILTSEMNLQQTVIHQASQALSCCTDEEHGKGSQVEAEAERLLLVATERRVALKAELDRLKGEGPAGQRKAPVGSSKAPENIGVSASKGSISLHELRLPLKADFICSTANKPESTRHYFFIMIRAGAENTVATPLASTHSGLSGDALTFTTKFVMSDVSSDFEIDIEVYYLVQKRELVTDKRKKPNKSKVIWRHVYEAHDLCMSAITPKRFLAITKSNQTPVVASPGGPNAVRTSNFVLIGSHKLTLSSVGKNKFPLEKIKYEGTERQLLSDMFHNKVPFLCPLEGHIYLRMQCEVGSKVEERGFLTMFEDVSGFGAWHRRWCVLSGYCISYWTYPDDEKRKNPIGRINLANCTSKKVEPANREFCARPNTFELITVRPQREDDKETLVSQCQNTMCVTKNWLSADTKDERNLWMKKLNQILVDLRMWQPDSSYRPL